MIMRLDTSVYHVIIIDKRLAHRAIHLSLHDALPIFSPDGSRLYVLDTANKTMKVVDLDARAVVQVDDLHRLVRDRKSTRLNSSHANISYAVICLKKKKYRQYSVHQTNSIIDEQFTYL